MTTFLIIIGKTSLALILFYIFYEYVLSKDKLFKRNRFYLLVAMVLSFVLPWINIPIFETSSLRPLSFTYIEDGNSAASQISQPVYQTFSWMKILFLLYFIGIAFFLLKTLVAYFQVFRIIRNSLHIPFGKQKLVTIPQNLSPFSFLHWIVVPETIHQHPSFDKMVQHELVHCRQYHSVDLFIAEILIFLQWFNPFAWLLRKAVSENLEYLVDEQMLTNGTDARDYQYSLLSFSMVGLKPAVANNFNTNLLKKRIAMMNKRKYPMNHRLHNFLIPVCLVIALLVTASFKKQVNSEEPIQTQTKVNPQNLESSDFIIVNPEKSPVNPDVSSRKVPIENRKVVASSEVDVEGLIIGYIMNNIKYPKEAININLEGIVEIPVKFSKSGAEFSSQESQGIRVTSGEILKQVVVVAYANDETSKHEPAKPNSESIKLLQEEVRRVLKDFSNVPKEMVGKTYIVSVKFILEELKVMGYGNQQNGNRNIDEDMKILIPVNDNSNSSEPVYILNNEKIITKEEMQKIDPVTIESVNVIKGEKLEHKKLGTINGSAVIITLKK